MAILKGLAAVWSTMDGITCTGAVVAATDKVQSADFTYSSEKSELKNGNGETKGARYHAATKELSITVIPAAVATGGIAASKTAMDGMIVQPGTVVTLTDTGSTTTDATHSGAYLLQQCRLRRTNNSYAIVEMDLKQYVANNCSTTVT